MTRPDATLAMVGATGGAGTTRLTVEVGATLARDGRDVAIFDAAFATQGLADYVAGRIDADLTAVLADDRECEAATYPVEVDAPGTLACCPAAAPFERLARAKTAGAATRFEEVLGRAATEYDHVLVDVPPVAANQAVAAVSAADRVAALAPATRRGADGLARLRNRLDDLQADCDAVVATARHDDPDDHPLIEDATATVPASDVRDPASAPVCDAGEGTDFRRAVADATAAALDVTLDFDLEEPGLLDRL